MLDITQVNMPTVLQSNINIRGTYKYYAAVKLFMITESHPLFKKRMPGKKTIWLRVVGKRNKKMRIRSNCGYVSYEGGTAFYNDLLKEIVFELDPTTSQTVDRLNCVTAKFIVPYVTDTSELNHSNHVVYLDKDEKLKISIISLSKKYERTSKNKPKFYKQFYKLYDIIDSNEVIRPEVCEIYQYNR